ncbi:MAG: hypothetical protein JST79_16525 [Acidobacteria bacterium]|nr:hypothetical protein [Acidobacteriota bacterium]
MRKFLLGCLLVVASASLWADPTLPSLFSHHMVLQRGRPIPVWGWADPGEKISVTLNSLTRDTVAAADGRWKLELPSMPAGGPFLLTVRGKKTLEVKDVLVGEVWIFSGQSNMSFALSGATGGEAAIATANNPEIRLFTVPQRSTMEPQTNVASQWVQCSPDTARSFSAAAYFFGRKLQSTLHVPVGLIHTSWPGTAAESWTPLEALRADAELKPILDRWNAAPAEAHASAGRAAEIGMEFDDFVLLPADGGPPVAFSNFDDGGMTNALHGYWTYQWNAGPQSAFDLTRPGRGGAGYAARISGALEPNETASLSSSFRADDAPADLSAYAGIRFYVRGSGAFQLFTIQPTIYDWDNYGSPGLQATADWQPITIWFKDLKQAGWGVVEPFTPASLTSLMIQVKRLPGEDPLPPSSLYQAMIAPLIPYGIRGAAWYQGESNAYRSYQYRRLLPALITAWRKAWGEGDFPFLVVQLPNLGQHDEKPSEALWSELREAQWMALRLPNTGLAVTIDVGDPNNLHPPRKQEVGERLALWTLGATYGEKIEYSGPLYESAKFTGAQVTIQFTHTGSGLQARGDGAGPAKLRGFALAGSDHVFHWADATIAGNTVVVTSPEVAAPVAVRYGWGGNPECNLYNQEGLPASPFRTDDWPGLTNNEK